MYSHNSISTSVSMYTHRHLNMEYLAIKNHPKRDGFCISSSGTDERT